MLVLVKPSPQARRLAMLPTIPEGSFRGAYLCRLLALLFLYSPKLPFSFASLREGGGGEADGRSTRS